MIDIIKEYLVSLGFSVNNQSMNQARQAMRDAEGFVSRFAGSSTVQFAVAGTAVTTFVIAANAALANFMNRIAQAELANQMFARQMYTSVENASAITNSLNAMGRSFEEIYLSPELMAQFKELRGMSYQLRPPEEFKEQTKNIRSITFEFTKLKMELTQASQWVFYYLNKYLAPYIAKFKVWMQGLNDSIVKNMPKWTKEIAQVVSWVGRLGVALFTAGQAIYKLFKEMPSNLKVAGSAFMGFFTLLKMGPIGWLIAGITSILLLMDDFTTYKSGGKSAFAGMWEELEKFKENFKGDDIFGGITSSVEGFTDAILALSKALAGLFESIDPKTIKAFVDGLSGGIQIIVDTVTKLINGLAAVVKMVVDIKNYDFDKLKEDTGLPSLSRSWDEFQKAGGFAEWSKKGFALKQSYSQPSAPSTTSQQNKTTVNNVSTFNVYGNEPYATATLVSNNIDSLNTRNFKGVIS